MAKNRRRKVQLSRSRLAKAALGGGHLRNVDGRAFGMRRLRFLVGSHTADLGGEQAITTAQATLIDRAAMLTVLLELTEQSFVQKQFKVSGQALIDYQRCVSTTRRLLESLGLERRARDITGGLTPMQYARLKAKGQLDDDGEVIDAEAAE